MSNANPQFRLSKSRFVAGWQCHKYLWWKVHEPGAPELVPDADAQSRMDQGTMVGEAARSRFPAGILVDLPYNDPRRVATTRDLIERRTPIVFEASFQEDGVYAAVDVLLRDGDDYTLIEVKAANEAYDNYIVDAAIQTYVVRRAGLAVRRVEIMHLNPAYVHPDRGDLFVREDVTPRVENLMPDIPRMIDEQLEALGLPSPPDRPIGEHCRTPGTCPFWDRCWPTAPDSVAKLHGARWDERAELLRAGYVSVMDLPETRRFTGAQERQRRAIAASGVVVEEGLAEALNEFSGRLGFLDFETVARAIPVWPGLTPWGKAAVQFSYHEVQPDGTYSHAEWLAEGPDDPREPLARALLEATANADRIAMYTPFEKTCIGGLAEALPHLAADLLALRTKLRDVAAIVRQYVYHPNFCGSFSLKEILTPLVPELTYADLRIADGGEASADLWRLMFVGHKIPPEERDELRRELLEYCKRDTWAMVKLLERLRGLAASM